MRFVALGSLIRPMSMFSTVFKPAGRQHGYTAGFWVRFFHAQG